MANNINIKKPKFNFTWFYMIVGGALLFFYLFGDGNNNMVMEKEYSELTEIISKGYVEDVTVFDNDEIEAYLYKTNFPGEKETAPEKFRPENAPGLSWG